MRNYKISIRWGGEKENVKWCFETQIDRHHPEWRQYCGEADSYTAATKEAAAKAVDYINRRAKAEAEALQVVAQITGENVVPFSDQMTLPVLNP